MLDGQGMRALALTAVLAALSPSRARADALGPSPAASRDAPSAGRSRPVLLEIRGANPGLQVKRQVPSGPAQLVCAGGCGQELDPGPIYVIRTERALIPNSIRFTLPADRSHVILDLKPVSALRPITGWSLLGGGVAAVLVSTGMLLGDNPGGVARDAPSRYWLAVYPLGLVAAGIGAYLLASSGPHITSDAGVEIASANHPPATGPSERGPRRERQGVRLTPYGLAF